MVSILNRDFRHPADGWYMIEPKGEHPNPACGVLQVIDDEAAQAIVEAFNGQAQAADFPGMLIDHEHFSHHQDKETRAFGWLTRLAGRADGIYGQIRWSDTGRAAVDGGDYRFFSTEYDAAKAEALNAARGDACPTSSLKRIRPLCLAGLTLTNRPNNKGGKPITNRAEAGDQRPEAGGANNRSSSLEPAASSLDTFAGAASAAPAASNQAGRDAPQNHKPMNRLTEQLGLAAEASEETVLEAVIAIMNRASAAEAELKGAKESAEKLRQQNQLLLETQIDSDLALHKNRFPSEQRENWKQLLTLNRQTALQALAALPETEPAGPANPVTRLVVNRAAARTPADPASPPAGDPLRAAVEDYRLRNRCSFEQAWNAVHREKPELFKMEQDS